MNLSIIRGDTTVFTLTLTDQAGAAVNLTSTTVFFTVKESLADADDDALIAKSTDSHSNPSGGVTAITLTSTDTAITPGAYIYDIQVKNTTDGAIQSVASGIYEVLPDVTQRTS